MADDASAFDDSDQLDVATCLEQIVGDLRQLQQGALNPCAPAAFLTQ